MALIKYLVDECKHHKAVFKFSAVITRIDWAQNHVHVYTSENVRFTAPKVVITVPMGVLLAPRQLTGSITFTPAIPNVASAAQSIGYGSVIKSVLRFALPFWESEAPDLHFIMSNQPVPTWWTDTKTPDNILTGWLAGPEADHRRNISDQGLLQLALQSLAIIFKKDIRILNKNLISFEIYNWANDPFARGAYSYTLAGRLTAREVLRRAYGNKVFFAGEAVYSGQINGTVESALCSGKEVASTVLQSISAERC